MVLQWWKERRTGGRHSVDFFGISLLTKQGSPCLLKTSLAYIFQWFAYLDATCKECLWIKCVFTPKLIVLINKFPTKTVHQLSITDVKMLLFTGKFWKIGKAYRVRNFFCLPDQQNSSHFFKLGAWRTAKTCACLLRLSALNSSPKSSK